MSYPVEGNGFADHVRDALRINRARQGRYAVLTGGRSSGISRRLILAEILTLPAAWYVDRRARPYRLRGIGIGADEFVSMDGLPPFRSWVDPPSLAAYRRADPHRIGREIRAAWRIHGFAGVHDVADGELERLAGEPCFHCTLRHLLESIRRVAQLAPGHEAAALGAGLPSCAPLSALILRLHLVGLPAAVRLDHRAAPLQAEGVPILCQDLPAIPPAP